MSRDDEHPCWVGFSPASCGHATAAMVIDEEPNPQRMREDAKELADWQKRGLRIERRSVAWVRQNLNWCETCCPKRKKTAKQVKAEQPSLL